MSVVKSKRGKSKFEVLVKANKLAAFTIRICSNEKNFPKRYRWTITSKIVNEAIDICRYIRKAKSEHPGRRARRSCHSLELAMDAFYKDLWRDNKCSDLKQSSIS